MRPLGRRGPTPAIDPAPGGGQRGFSLLETLVAFAVLAICLGVVLRVFGGGTRAAALTDGYARATLIAESFLAALGTEKELRLGRQEGVLAGGYRWLVQVTPLPVQQERISTMSFPILPYWVEVTVSWGEDERRSLRLNTVRLIANEAGGPGQLPGQPRTGSGQTGNAGASSGSGSGGPGVND